MSTYHGRTGPNFSQFLDTLNTIQTYEQDIIPGDDLNLDQELAMFTNADFTEFDATGAMANNQPINFDLNGPPHHNMEGPNDLKYEELLGEPNHYLSSFGAPIQPAPQQPVYPQHSAMVSPTSSSMSPPAMSVKAGMKRKQDMEVAGLGGEDTTRVAAEEDKRRRNTAASARFRVKKKQREQALERTVKDVNDKNQLLQAKVDQLEMENKWLKNLITEKSGTQTEKEIAELYQKYRRESEERDSRAPEHKDGVGTK